MAPVDQERQVSRQAMKAAGRGMTLKEVLALPVATDVPTAGRAFGLGRNKSFELVRTGEFPCPVLRIGNAYRVTRADLLRALGISDEGTPGTQPPPAPSGNASAA